MHRFLRWFERRWRWVLAVVVGGLAIWVAVAVYYRRSPVDLLDQGFRVLATWALSGVHEEDRDTADAHVAVYHVGIDGSDLPDPRASWKRLEARVPGFELLGGSCDGGERSDIPFVFESMDAPYIAHLRDEYRLEQAIGNADSEYEAQLRLGTWVGTQFPHGLDELPDGGDPNFDPDKVIRTGRQGKAYWCEIAAKLTVYAATSLGWPARLATASRDGFTWEHAIAELWSNEHRKWYLLDTDYNQVYERGGVPLGAYELCHEGPTLQKSGQLLIRVIAPEKPGVDRTTDLMPYYIYTHIDMRNDWFSRRLPRGSPAGGDIATWWTARPEFRGQVTVSRRVDDVDRFNWPVNTVSIHALDAEQRADGQLALTAGLSGYSPYFKVFQVSVDGAPWRKASSPWVKLVLPAGEHVLKARVVTRGGHSGPEAEARFAYRP